MTDRLQLSRKSDEQQEWRLTYDLGDGAGGVVREGFGLDEKGARAAFKRYSENPDITDLRLWHRPKPAKWEQVGEFGELIGMVGRINLDSARKLA
jgi:hypothetical protein